MWLGVTSSFTILIPLLIGLVNYKNISLIQRRFIWFVLFSFVVELISIILAFNKINNHQVFKAFLIFDLIFFLFFYIDQGFLRMKNTQIWLFIIPNILFAFLSLFWNNVFTVVVLILQIVISGVIILKTFDNMEITPFDNFNFWIAAARLFYFVVVFFIYSYTYLKGFEENNSFFVLVFTVVNFLGNLTCNLMYGFSFLCRRTIE